MIVALAAAIAALTAAIVLASGRGGTEAQEGQAMACGVVPRDLFAGASPQAPVLALRDSGIRAGETTSIPLVLSHAPGGLSGYLVEVSLSDQSPARIVGADFPEFGLTRQLPAGEGLMRLAAVDLHRTVEPGASDVILAHVLVEATTPGQSTLQARAVQVDDDSGNPITPQAAPAALMVC